MGLVMPDVVTHQLTDLNASSTASASEPFHS